MGEVTPVRLEAGALPPDWRPLPEIPARRYTDAAFDAAERDRLHQAIDARIGTERIAPELQVAQVLAATD